MLSILFLVFLILSIWTGVILLRKDSNDQEIKNALKEIAVDFFKLFIDFKKLVSGLKKASRSEKSQENCQVEEQPKLIQLIDNKIKDIA